MLKSNRYDILKEKEKDKFMEQNELEQILSLTKTLFLAKYGESYKVSLEQISIYNIDSDNVCYIHTSNVEVQNELNELKEKFIEQLNIVTALKGLIIRDIVVKREINENNLDVSYIEESSEMEFEDDGNTGLKAEFTLDNFIAGNNVEYSYILCKKVVETIVNDLPNDYTPLLIYGDSGLGKTHLGQAIGNEVLSLRPEKKVKYLTAEDFNNEFLEAIKKGNFKNTDNISRSGSFRQKYRKLDLIIIDDIQFFERVFGKGEGSVEEEFFNTFNTLYLEKKQIVFISDRNPRDIKNLSDRIRTRIGSGVIVEIQKPDFSTRVAILKKFCEERHSIIDDKPLEYIATHVSDSVRDLQGILKSVITTSQLLDRQVDIDMIKEVLEKRKNMIKSTFTADSIVKKIAEIYSITVEDIKSQKRKAAILLPRQIAMYLIKENLDITLDAIGKVFDRDHSTVLNAIKRIEERLDNDEAFKIELNNLNRDLKG